LHLDQIGLQRRLVMRWLQIVHLGVAGSAVVERGPKVSAVVERGPNGRMRGKPPVPVGRTAPRSSSSFKASLPDLMMPRGRVVVAAVWPLARPVEGALRRLILFDVWNWRVRSKTRDGIQFLAIPSDRFDDLVHPRHHAAPVRRLLAEGGYRAPGKDGRGVRQIKVKGFGSTEKPYFVCVRLDRLPKREP
jgi:hypothetical protein